MFILFPRRRTPGDGQPRPPRRIGLFALLFLILTILGIGIVFNWGMLIGWVEGLSGEDTAL